MAETGKGGCIAEQYSARTYRPRLKSGNFSDFEYTNRAYRHCLLVAITERYKWLWFTFLVATCRKMKEQNPKAPSGTYVMLSSSGYYFEVHVHADSFGSKIYLYCTWLNKNYSYRSYRNYIIMDLHANKKVNQSSAVGPSYKVNKSSSVWKSQMLYQSEQVSFHPQKQSPKPNHLSSEQSTISR